MYSCDGNNNIHVSAFTVRDPLEACAAKTVVECVLEVVTCNKPAVPTVQHATFEVERAMVLGAYSLL